MAIGLSNESVHRFPRRQHLVLGVPHVRLAPWKINVRTRPLYPWPDICNICTGTMSRGGD